MVANAAVKDLTAVELTKKALSTYNFWDPIRQPNGKFASKLCQKLVIALFDGLTSCSVPAIALSSMHNMRQWLFIRG